MESREWKPSKALKDSTVGRKIMENAFWDMHVKIFTDDLEKKKNITYYNGLLVRLEDEIQKQMNLYGE